MIWIAGLCVVCFGICLPLFLYYKKSLRLHLASAYKSLGTLCAFLPALIAAIRLEPACWICAAALLLNRLIGLEGIWLSYLVGGAVSVLFLFLGVTLRSGKRGLDALLFLRDSERGQDQSVSFNHYFSPFAF